MDDNKKSHHLDTRVKTNTLNCLNTNKPENKDGSYVPLYRWWAGLLYGQTLVEDPHTFSAQLLHQVYNQSCLAEPEMKHKRSNFNNKHLKKSLYYLIFSLFETKTANILTQSIDSHFDFGFIWSFVGVRHFGPLFLSLSVSLHHATKKGTFVLERYRKIKNEEITEKNGMKKPDTVI